MTQKGALKRIERAITAMVELQDAGYGTDNIMRILEKLNHEEQEITLEGKQ